MAGTDQLTKLQQADHDVLIGVKVTLDSFVSESRQNRADDTSRFADHEVRLRALETSIEVNKGTDTTKNDSKRTMIEVFGLMASFALLIITWYSGHH